jgi:hypothetical protein
MKAASAPASFFSRGGGELQSARCFVTSIAVQLAHRSPAFWERGIQRHARLSGHRQPNAQRPVEASWCTARARRPRPQSPLAIIIDALDECADENGVAFVLQLAAGTIYLVLKAAGLLLLVTSRPEDSSFAKGWRRSPSMSGGT